MGRSGAPPRRGDAGTASTWSFSQLRRNPRVNARSRKSLKKHKAQLRPGWEMASALAIGVRFYETLCALLCRQEFDSGVSEAKR